MGAPWAEMSSAERTDAILLALDELEREPTATTSAAAIAMRVQREHEMVLPRMGRNGHANGMKRPNQAVRVTPGIIALRREGLLRFTSRQDGMSGTADALTAAGRARVAELRNTTTNEEATVAKSIEELIEQVREQTGAVPDDRGRAVLEHEGFTYGDRVRVVEDDEEAGVFADDEGVVVIERVGAAEYQNERVALFVVPKGMDVPLEVQLDNIEQV